MITVRLLDLRHLEDYTKTTLFEKILKCFANGLINFKDQLCNPIENFKTVSTNLKSMNVIGQFAKRKSLRIFGFQKT